MNKKRVVTLCSFALIYSGVPVGCSRAERLSEKPPEGAAQIQRWGVIGMSVDSAKRTMEQHRFTCSMKTNSAFGIHQGIDYLYCDRAEGWVISRRWQVALIVRKTRVDAIVVTTGLTGP